MSKIKDYVQQSILKIMQFNEVCGNLDNITTDKLALQLDLIQEEYLETVEAFDNNNDVEFLDGTIDMFVVIVGQLLKLEAAGFDVAEAMKRVDDNNLSKFPSLVEDFSYSNEFTCTVNEKYNVAVIKDSNGKVRKPLEFKPVDISDCAVAGFLKESVV